MLELVRTGVERFIVRNTTVEDFFETIRAVTETDTTYSHQLTRSVFARIVRIAKQKRTLRGSK